MNNALTEKEARRHNTGFASGGLTCKHGDLCFYSSSVLVDSFVLRNPPERKVRKRYSCLLQQIHRTETGQQCKIYQLLDFDIFIRHMKGIIIAGSPANRHYATQV